MTDYIADVIVVGAGVAGLLIAHSLVQEGINVIVLESGPRVNRSEALENYRNAVAKTPDSPYPDVPHAPRPTVLDFEGYFVQEGPMNFKSIYERRVGGTTWHWLGTTMRHLPNDFRIQSLYGVGVDWPITYDDLEPWYYRAEIEMGVTGDDRDDLDSLRRDPYPQPPIEMTYLDRKMQVAARSIGLDVRTTPQARNSVAYDGRPPCCGSATCVPISWALANDPLYPYRGPLENAGIENFRDGQFRAARSAFRMAIGEDGWSFPGQPPPDYVLELIEEGFRGRALREEVNYRTARQVRFANLMEQLPHPENRIVPAFDQLDEIGIPRPRVYYHLDDYLLQGMAEARRVSESVFNALGVSLIEHAEEFESAGHVMGTYRMGGDPRTSVVNPEQRSHDHPNLYLVGSGVFPTGATANPTLTLGALALATAGTIKRELRRAGLQAPHTAAGQEGSRN